MAGGFFFAGAFFAAFFFAAFAFLAFFAGIFHHSGIIVIGQYKNVTLGEVKME
ncbi:MAG: hypothetical protein ABDH63_06330 [Candidatus Caldarchaeales archaeon]